MIIRLSWRNIWRNPRRTAIILTAIVVGIISMVVMSAFGRGVMEGMVDNAIKNLVGHITIQDEDYRVDPGIEHGIESVDSVLAEIDALVTRPVGTVTRLRVEGMLSTSRDNAGVEIIGIEPDRERSVSFIGQPAFAGESLDAADANGLLIGHALLDRLGLDIGKKVVLLCRDRSGNSSARAFRIRGSYRTELRDTEKRFVFVNLRVLQDITGLDSAVTEISITLEDSGLYRSQPLDALQTALNDRIGGRGLVASTWKQRLPAIRAYIDMFDVYMLIWFVVVFIAMGFGLANTVLMAVYERMREFGLQRALGMRSGSIVRVVMVEVLLLLTIGIILADAVSFVLVELVFSGGLNLGGFAEGAEMFGIDRIIHPIMTFRDLVMANGVVIVLGLVVGLYPAAHAARFTPVETMRHT